MEDYRLEQSGQEVQDILNGAAMQSDLTAETERATEAEQTLQGNIDAEERDRKAADLTLQGNIDAEELRAKAAEKQNADDIDALEEKVPSGASASNKLATESYVDDSVATATATFRGTYNLVSDLHLTVDATEQQIATALALAISTADNNDYCFVQVPTSSETPTEIKEINRYKFNGTAWSFEYKLNNSGFTAAQWAAINSGITSGDVTKLSALPTNAQLTTLLAGKQDVLTFDDVPTEGSSHPVKSGGVYSAIDDEKTARENADSSLSSAIEAILLLIPSAATSLNKLADKAFVNSSIATASATFRGTYNLVTDLSLTVSATHAQIATALAGAVSDEDNNDYAFVQIPTSDATPTQIAKTERYKFNGTAWEYEYDLNNSGYTAAQWAAINSGITEALVTKLSALPTNAELTTALGVLTSSITAINQKIPSAASQSNKLVDTAAMESYIVQVLDVLTASFNVTSTDGHVTVQISQVDGKITSVAVSTSDIASASDLSLIAGRVTTAEGNISTNAADIANLQDAYAALTQSALVVVKPTDTWPVASPASKTIYRVVDRVNTPPQNYSDYMWNGTVMVLMATYDNAIDDEPTAGSHNVIRSGSIEINKLYRKSVFATDYDNIINPNIDNFIKELWIDYDGNQEICIGLIEKLITDGYIALYNTSDSSLFENFHTTSRKEGLEVIVGNHGICVVDWSVMPSGRYVQTVTATRNINLNYVTKINNFPIISSVLDIRSKINKEIITSTLYQKNGDIIKKGDITQSNGIYIYIENGILKYGYNATYAISDYVNIVGVSSLRWHGWIPAYAVNVAAVAFFDKYLNYIGAITVGETGTYTTYQNDIVVNTIPEGACFARCSTEKNFEEFYLKINDDANILDVLSHRQKYFDKTIDDPRFVKETSGLSQMFKNWGFIGDSLCSGEIAYTEQSDPSLFKYFDCYDNSYGQNICDITGSHGVNYSEGGLTTKTWWKKYITNQDSGWTKDGTTSIFAQDVHTSYLLALGTNDRFKDNMPAGNVLTDIDLSDYNNNADTFAGNYGKIIQKIRELNSRSPIFLLLYPNVTTRDYDGVVMDLANLFNGVFVIDLYTELLLLNVDMAQYTYGGHYTTQGYIYLSYLIQNVIDKIIRENMSYFNKFSLIGKSVQSGEIIW